MPSAVLYPSYQHPALEERYASWQSQMLLRREHPGFHTWQRGQPAAAAVSAIDAPFVLVVTDPLLLPSPGMGAALERALGGSFAAVPGSNEGGHPEQRVSLRPYMTLREFELASKEVAGGLSTVTWERHDPGAFLCATDSLRSTDAPLSTVLEGREVVIQRGAVVHRWASLRGQVRGDLLERISPGARSVLEFGCGEAPLGEALKRRQECRVVGIELDRDAAAIARQRVDEVHCGDVRQIVGSLQESFDFVVGGDIVEHLDEPWTFLTDLRRITAPGGQLLLSLPNIANASIIGDLLEGRFDYVYMGIACVGHLRFFTRQSLEELLTIAGWEVVSIEPQSLAQPPETVHLLEALGRSAIPHRLSEISPTGFYVTARNPA